MTAAIAPTPAPRRVLVPATWMCHATKCGHAAYIDRHEIEHPVSHAFCAKHMIALPADLRQRLVVARTTDGIAAYRQYMGALRDAQEYLNGR